MSSSSINNTITILLIASAAIVIGGLAIIPIFELQQVEAGCEKGFPNSARAFNATKGRCLNP